MLESGFESRPQPKAVGFRVSLIDLSISEGLVDSARSAFGERMTVLAQCASRLGVDLQVFSPPQLQRLSVANEARMKRSDALWIFGAIPEPGEYEFLEERLSAVLGIQGQGRLYETWDQVDEAFSLARSYPIIAAVGVPQAKTHFSRLPAGWRRLPRLLRKWALGLSVRQLVRRLKAESGSTEEPLWPRFVRSFYGTTKRSAYESYVESTAELSEKSLRMIEEVRGQHPIGGLALREMLPIALAWDSRQRGPVQREYRVIILGGEPIFWSIDVSLNELILRFSERAVLEMVQLEDALRRQMLDYSRALGRAFRLKLLCADFAVLSDGRLVLVETNAGMSCGWAHEAALVGVFGRVLAHLAKRSLTREQLEALCDACGLSRWGQGIAYDFVVDGEGASSFQVL